MLHRAATDTGGTVITQLDCNYLIVDVGRQAQTVVGLKTIILETSYLPPSYLSGSCLKLIRGILKREPTERFTLIDIRNSQWLQGQTPLQPLPHYHFVPTSIDQPVSHSTSFHSILSPFGRLVIHPITRPILLALLTLLIKPK